MFGLSEGRTKNLNVFILGLSFLCLFTAFQTMGNIQQTIIDSASTEGSGGYVEDFSGSGFYSLAIIYATLAAFAWFAPSAMVVLGNKLTMLSGAVTYAMFIASFFYLQNWLLYTASAVLGIGAALLWSAQGAFLTANSTKETMSRNSGIFWAMLQCSLLIGNTFAYFQFRGLNEIDTDTRVMTVGVLFGSAVLGCMVFILLLPPADSRPDRSALATFWILPDSENPVEKPDSPIEALKKSIKLFFTVNMLQLVIFFFYTGMQLSFWSGVYGPSLGRVNGFPDPKSMPGLHGIFIGVGQIIGGLVFGIFGSWTNKTGRWPVVALGTVVSFTAFALVMINIPNDAPLGENPTGETVLETPNEILALACSTLIGFGDAAANTQVISLLGGVYSDNPGPAFAIFKFVQSIASSIAFSYTESTTLYVQIPMLWGVGLIGAILFARVDIITKRRDAKEGIELTSKPEASKAEDLENTKL